MTGVWEGLLQEESWVGTHIFSSSGTSPVRGPLHEDCWVGMHVFSSSGIPHMARVWEGPLQEWVMGRNPRIFIIRNTTCSRGVEGPLPGGMLGRNTHILIIMNTRYLVSSVVLRWL